MNGATPTPTALDSPYLLVVEDDSTSCLMLSRFWQKEGYRIQVVHDGEDALLECERTLPDIILMDAVMPKLDGFKCCQILREKYGNDCPPILMITGLNDSESVDYAFDVGATDFVTKPFHWAVLRQRVRRILQAHKDHRQLQASLAKERSLHNELKKVNHELQRLATLDGLTQIANRRLFDERLRLEWRRLRREHTQLSLILIDIDYFKAYNDTYGHLAGDQCLYEVAQIIQQTARRPADLAARYGGEEFALILPNTPSQGAVFLAESIQKQLKEKALCHEESRVCSRVTVSIGVATMIPNGNSPNILIHKADTLLYTAKAQGRNRIATSAEEPDDLEVQPVEASAIQTTSSNSG